MCCLYKLYMAPDSSQHVSNFITICVRNATCSFAVSTYILGQPRYAVHCFAQLCRRAWIFASLACLIIWIAIARLFVHTTRTCSEHYDSVVCYSTAETCSWVQACAALLQTQQQRGRHSAGVVFGGRRISGEISHLPEMQTHARMGRMWGHTVPPPTKSAGRNWFWRFVTQWPQTHTVRSSFKFGAPPTHQGFF